MVGTSNQSVPELAIEYVGKLGDITNTVPISMRMWGRDIKGIYVEMMGFSKV